MLNCGGDGGPFSACSCSISLGSCERFRGSRYVCYLIERELQPFDDLVSAKSQIKKMPY